jgi:hypothetical protein
MIKGVKEPAVTSNQPATRTIPWGALVLATVGISLFLFGVTRFVLRHHFGFSDALYCCLAIIPAGILLLVFDYVLHHAKLVSVIPLVAAVMFVVTSPAFDVGLGLALLGAVGGPALRDWKDEKRLRESSAAQAGENKESA